VKTLWSELKPYYEAQYEAKCIKADKEVDEDELDAILRAKHEELVEAVKYRDYGPPTHLKTVHVSAAARALGLPAIRSLAEDRLDFWCRSILEQSEEVGFTPEQERFVTRLQLAKDTLAIELNAPQSEVAVEFVEALMEAWDASKERWEGTELNVGSPKQMAELFYGMLGLDILIRNQSAEGSVRDVFEMEGSPATNDLAMKTWLVELEEGDWRREVIELISTMRACKQRESLYYRPYPLWKSPIDGRIHPQFNNCGTITRRPTGSSPNLLQVSKHKDGGRMRSTILPQSDDEVVVSIDFSQQELALLAAVSGDENLLACYSGPVETRRDVHTMTSTTIMNIYNRREGNSEWTYADYNRIRKDSDHPDFKRSKQVRDKQGKPTNFLLVYGGSAIGLARKLIVNKTLAEQIYEGFHHTYPGVEKFQERAIKFAEKHGYYPTVYGNRKHAPNILDKDGAKRSGAQRQVVNMPMQGSAADILKMVLREYNNQRIAEIMGSTLYACVYDEIVASVPKDRVRDYILRMVEIMQVIIPGSPVQLVADASFGPSWGEQYELEGDYSEDNIVKALNHYGT
jgi:DNA polymerase-1